MSEEKRKVQNFINNLLAIDDTTVEGAYEVIAYFNKPMNKKVISMFKNSQLDLLSTTDMFKDFGKSLKNWKDVKQKFVLYNAFLIACDILYSDSNLRIMSFYELFMTYEINYHKADYEEAWQKLELYGQIETKLKSNVKSYQEIVRKFLKIIDKPIPISENAYRDVDLFDVYTYFSNIKSLSKFYRFLCSINNEEDNSDMLDNFIQLKHLIVINPLSMIPKDLLTSSENDIASREALLKQDIIVDGKPLTNEDKERVFAILKQSNLAVTPNYFYQIAQRYQNGSLITMKNIDDLIKLCVGSQK